MKIGTKTMEDGIMKKSLFIAAALLTLAACTREMNIDTPAGDMTITARTETSADTRTIVEGQTHVYWEPGDEIKVFAGGKSGKFTTDISAASASATFNGTLGEDAWAEGMDLWAVYPYSEDAVFSDGTITTVLPSEQVARAGSFGKDMNLAIAHSMTSDLQFYNVGGGIRFTLSQDGITEVVLEGLKKETLAGKVKVGFQDGKPVIREVTEGKASITIAAPDGEAFKKNAWYYIVAVPGALENGFKMSFRKDDALGSREFDMTVSIKRGIFGTLTHADKGSGASNPIPEAVDLGLPSGLKWASFNLGASKPEEYGDYYAWGETEPKDAYTWSNYKWCIDGNDHAITKYCSIASRFDYGYNGFTDGKIILDPEDDAAYVNLGGKWRIPADWEWAELLDNCSSAWTTENGVYGCRFTSNLNNNSIFFPAAGVCINSSLYFTDSCTFWSSSLDTYSSDSAMLAFFGPDEMEIDGASRYGGPTIRPVYGDLVIIPVESVSLDKTELELFVGDFSDLVATILPDNASIKSVIWSSSNDAVASVTSGTVTGWMAGSAVITVATINGEKTASCLVTVKDPSIPEAIDMGLSVKWASFNLGATKPEEYGDYFAWGETEPYYESLDPLIWRNGKENGYDWASYKWCMGSWNSLTKYCTKSDYGYNGFTDDKTVLDPEDDAAHVNLGGKWRMPTHNQWVELVEKCTWKWTQENGVNGWLVTSNLNGNIIFLPATGFLDRAKLFYDGQHLCYWSSTLCEANHTYDAQCVGGEPNGVGSGSEGNWRCDGIPVRPVYGDPLDIPVEDVILDKTEQDLIVGRSTTLVATVLPSYATDNSVSWSSSNESVATVSSTGTVTGVATGSAIITVTTVDGGKMATCIVTVTETSIPIPEAVDLGLPSGLKWASFNLGASKPEESGDYYAWGETEPRTDYSWNSYKWSRGSSSKLTKYCSNSSYGYNGFTDSTTVLDLEDDAAYMRLGDSWRMPTYEDWSELRENCKWILTTQNGVNGMLITASNGNSIFLPAAGLRKDTNLYNVDSGIYWSSSLNTMNSVCAWEVSFDSSGYVSTNSGYRYFGCSVRAVSE